MQHSVRRLLLTSAALVLAIACSDDDASDGVFASDTNAEPPSGDRADPGGPGAGADGMAPDSDEDPDEVEEEIAFEPPAVGERSVYVANPATGQVAIVDAASFAIDSVAAGVSPEYVATVPGSDVAVVLDGQAPFVTVLRSAQGQTRVSTLDLDAVANRVRFSPDGRWAVAFHDASSGDAAQAGFHDASVIDLETDRAVHITTGFRPSGAQFNADSTRAFVITEDGVSIIELDALADSEATALFAAPIALSADPGEAAAVDVSITPDGRHALARRPGDSELRLLDLDSQQLHTLDLTTLQEQPEMSPGDAGADAGGPRLGPADLDVSDLDLAPDGSFALAVLRSHSAIVRIPLPGGFEDEPLELIDMGGQLVGSATIAPNGKLAAAFTTAVVELEAMTLIDLDDHGLTPVRLRKAVRAVALSADGSRALVLHQQREGNPSEPGIDEDTRIDRSAGYSLVDTSSAFAKLQVTPTPVSGQGGFVITPDASHLFVILRNDERDIRQLQTAELDTFRITELSLSDPPVSLGVVPSVSRVFVGQEAAGGRITFVDWTTGQTQTVSAFELSSRIRE